MRVIFFGMPGNLAPPALAAVLASGAEVAAVIVPAPPGAPPVSVPPALSPRPAGIAHGPQPAPPSPLALAAARGVPTLALRRMRAPEVAAAVAALAADLAVVACWPWRFPPALLAAPRLGCLNLHPSPLPELRGPDPLFWAFQEGRARSAVTVHWMDAGLDTGDIAAVAPLGLPAGIGWDEAERGAGAVGAGLLAELLPRLAAGELPRRPQGPGGSYRPAPAENDFAVNPAWPAERAFRFMRGVAAWGAPFRLRPGGAARLLGAAIGYTPEGRLGAPVVVDGGRVRVQMAPGVLEATLADV
jgi:methionyl-tRNA formyltransferase